MDKENFDKYLNDDGMEDNFENDSEYEDDYEHNNKNNGRTFTRGFLAALTICIVAIGAAVWTTINNVSTYLNPTISTETDSIQTNTDNDSTGESSENSALADAQVTASIITGSAAHTDTSDEAKNDKVTFTAVPIKSAIIQDYSEMPVYNETLKDYRAHPATDYAADVDDKVRCMGSGTVTNIYYDEMLGNVVEIEHSDSVKSYYCGLAKTTLVQVGDEVSGGDFVGTVYSIPCETAGKSHVHIAVTENGEWKNLQDYYKHG